jgi:hypothetical protein
VKTSFVDDEPTNPLELIETGSLKRTALLFAPADHESNIVNTYFSGGKWPGQ